jgi:hypothetical protein
MKREEHAARINETWQKSVNAVIETGLRIIDARNELERDEYIAMVKNDLHFSRSMAFRYVAIASDKVLIDVAHVQHLPAAVSVLYDLTVIANKGFDLEAGIAGGAIHPRMQRKDVRALLPPPPQRDDDLEEPDDTAETNPLAVAWESASQEERASFLHALGREALLEALAAIDADDKRTADRAEARSATARCPPIDETVTDDFSDTLVARMWRGESVGAPEEPYETTALANGNAADRWSEK